jgi:hypothetical protein
MAAVTSAWGHVRKPIDLAISARPFYPADDQGGSVAVPDESVRGDKAGCSVRSATVKSIAGRSSFKAEGDDHAAIAQDGPGAMSYLETEHFNVDSAHLSRPARC